MGQEASPQTLLADVSSKQSQKGCWEGQNLCAGWKGVLFKLGAKICSTSNTSKREKREARMGRPFQQTRQERIAYFLHLNKVASLANISEF